MNRRALDGLRAEVEFRSLLGQIRDYFQRGPNLDRKMLMAIQADVQKLIDDIRQNSDLVKSNTQALQVQSKQITDLRDQVAGLQAGQVLTAEDLAAIQGGVAQLEETNTALQDATLANTPGQPTVPPAGSVDDQGNTPAPSEPAPKPVDPSI